MARKCQPNDFQHILPKERLGRQHESLESFHESIGTTPARKNTKEYTLVVVVTNDERILLGKKHRGFGTGKYNSFGGKFLPNESVEECACRELQEETNLRIPLCTMRDSKVGIQKFTFEDNDKEMLVHLFFVTLLQEEEEEQIIRGCEEITPEWFESFESIPLDNMFADDSLWLTTLLSRAKTESSSLSSPPVYIDGSYHFQSNCEETNTILHYYMDVRKNH